MAASRTEIEDMDDSPSLTKQTTGVVYSLGRAAPRKATSTGAKRNHERTDSEANELKRRKLSEEERRQELLDTNVRLTAFQEEITEIRRAQSGYESKLVSALSMKSS